MPVLLLDTRRSSLFRGGAIDVLSWVLGSPRALLVNGGIEEFVLEFGRGIEES